MNIIDHKTIRKHPLLAFAGCSIKKPSYGEEFTAVLNYIKQGFPVEDCCDLCVFIEPSIGYSFPDIVLVYSDRRIYKSWNLKRRELAKSHLNFISDLYSRRIMRLSNIVREYKKRWHLSWFKTKKGLFSAIEFLSKLKIIEMVDGGNYIKIKTEIAFPFSAKKIIAIEAKRRKWKKGLQQTILHTGYASESYLWMIEPVYKKKELFNKARDYNVGLLLEEETYDSPYFAAKQFSIPCGRASWYLDHWAWLTLTRDKK